MFYYGNQKCVVWRRCGIWSVEMIEMRSTVIGEECYMNKGQQGSDGKAHQRTILLLCGLAVSKHNKNERYEGNKIHATHISKTGTDQRIKKALSSHMF